MSNTTLTKIEVMNILHTRFDMVVARFKKVPGGDNWHEMETYMWAIQKAVSMKDEELSKLLWDVGIGYYAEKLARLARESA